MTMSSPHRTGATAPDPQSMERDSSPAKSRTNSSPTTVYFSNKDSRSSSGGSGPSSPSSLSVPSTPASGKHVFWPSPQFAKTDQTLDVHCVSSCKTAHGTSSPKGPPNGHYRVSMEQRSRDYGRGSCHETPQTKPDASSCSCCCCKLHCYGEVPGNLAAICCCPLSLLSLLACLCFKCPKQFAFKTVKRVRDMTRHKEDLEDGEGFDEYEPELKRSRTNGSLVSSTSSSNSCDSVQVDTKLKQDMSNGFEQQYNYFFPTPEPETGLNR